MSGGGAEGSPEKDLAGLPNIGPKTAERLRAVGISTPLDLRRVGAVEAFDQVEEAFPQATTLVLLFALEGALRGVTWTALPEDVKADLRKRASG
jgi:DNA transformation protein